MPVDVHAGTRLRRLAAVKRGERVVQTAAEKALAALAGVIMQTLEASGMDPGQLDARHPEWTAAVDDVLLPALADVYGTAVDAAPPTVVTAAAQVDEAPGPFTGDRALSDVYASQYLTDARNRLVGVADTLFAQVATSLEEGRQRRFTDWVDPAGITRERVGESIPQLAARVNDLLDEATKTRAVTIARTEVIAANNAGYAGAAAYHAQVLGYTPGQVVKQWLATSDGRTRESHVAADGQQVVGMENPFDVGGASLAFPGDPSGPADEVVNCRCTILTFFPGDPEYPADLATAAGLEPLPSVSPFTAEGLQSALDPARRRTAAAVKKELEATAAGRDLTTAIRGFTETRGGVANLRANIEKVAAGTASKAVAARTRAFVDAVNTYPTDAVPALYRGVAVRVEANTNEWWDAFEAQFQPGQRMTLNASSFSSSERKAAEFSGMIGGTKRATSNYTAVRMVLEGGPHALPVEQLSKFKSEKEWITGGEFEVVGYTAATPAQPYYRVVVRQIKSLEAP